MVAICKERFSKSYRHRDLDERLTKQRCRTEARLLEKCATKQDIMLDVPKVLRVENTNYPEPALLYLEYVDGTTVRDYLEDNVLATNPHKDNTTTMTTLLPKLAESMGSMIAQLHAGGMVHGDLTTSNMMLRREIILEQSPAAAVAAAATSLQLPANHNSDRFRPREKHHLRRGTGRGPVRAGARPAEHPSHAARVLLGNGVAGVRRFDDHDDERKSQRLPNPSPTAVAAKPGQTRRWRDSSRCDSAVGSGSVLGDYVVHSGFAVRLRTNPVAPSPFEETSSPKVLPHDNQLQLVVEVRAFGEIISKDKFRPSPIWFVRSKPLEGFLIVAHFFTIERLVPLH